MNVVEAAERLHRTVLNRKLNRHCNYWLHDSIQWLSHMHSIGERQPNPKAPAMPNSNAAHSAVHNASSAYGATSYDSHPERVRERPLERIIGHIAIATDCHLHVAADRTSTSTTD